MIETLKKFLKNETGQAIAIIIVGCLCFWIFGCQPKVQSLNGSGFKVGRMELQNELDHILSKAELRFAELNRQEEIRQIIFNFALLTAKSGAINPIGVLTTIGMILGLGATADNVVKRKKIKKLKNGN